MPLVVAGIARAGGHTLYHFCFLLTPPGASLWFSQGTVGPVEWALALKALTAGA